MLIPVSRRPSIGATKLVNVRPLAMPLGALVSGAMAKATGRDVILKLLTEMAELQEN